MKYQVWYQFYLRSLNPFYIPLTLITNASESECTETWPSTIAVPLHYSSNWSIIVPFAKLDIVKETTDIASFVSLPLYRSMSCAYAVNSLIVYNWWVGVWMYYVSLYKCDVRLCNSWIPSGVMLMLKDWHSVFRYLFNPLQRNKNYHFNLCKLLWALLCIHAYLIRAIAPLYIVP